MLNFQTLEPTSLMSIRPHRIFGPGPVGPRRPPIPVGPSSIGLDDMVFEGFPQDHQGSRARHFILHDCLVISGHASDGAVIDSSGRLVAETARFARFRADPGEPEGHARIHEASVDALAVVFDSAWTNYYHFLVFGIGKHGRFAEHLPAHVPTLLPLMEPAFDRSEVRMDRATVDRILSLTVGQRPVISLPAGAHRVGTLHLFWPDSPQSATVVETDGYLEPFRELAASTGPGLSSGPRRRLLIRRGGPDPRMDDTETARVISRARETGFEVLTLETMGFDQQVAAFAGAEAVVAAHGAGLANLVFCEPSCLVVELNRRLGDQTRLRPWFYQIAARRNMPYAGFNMDTGPGAVDEAFAYLKSRL